MSAAPAEKKMEDALSLAARSIAVRAIADSTANGRSFAHHSKLRLNQACSNAVAQDTEPLKALSFTANPLVRSHQERRSNLRSPVRSQTVRSRFERPTLQLTLAVVPASKGSQQGSQQIEARVQSACSMRVFARRVRIVRRVRFASLFERARRTSTRTKERRCRRRRRFQRSRLRRWWCIYARYF